MTDQATTKTDDILKRINNNRFLSFVVVVGLIVVGLGAFTNGLGQISSFFGSLFEQPRQSAADGNQSSDEQTIRPQSNGPTNETSVIRFVSGTPFPEGVDLIKPGSRPSLALTTYPSPPAELSHIHGEPFYDVPIKTGPFKRALFYYQEDDPDPKIRYVTFVTRGDNVPEDVKKALLATLGSSTVQSSVAGNLLREDVGGFRVTVKRHMLEIEKAW